MDLLKPLVPWIMVDGKKHGVEYEGLPLICYECGVYGHPRERCTRKIHSTVDATTTGQVPSQAVPIPTPSQPKEKGAEGASSESSPSQFGSWMQEAQNHGKNRRLQRSRRKSISTLRDEEGVWCTDGERLRSWAFSFYKMLYSVEATSVPPYSGRGMFPTIEDSMADVGLHILDDPPDRLVIALQQDVEGFASARLCTCTD
ncbi:hypothetical protein K1719_009693 [Acacia pycnantha]|nr:hypothetical protein K1719_009693 [Acacia pycnantha]